MRNLLELGKKSGGILVTRKNSNIDVEVFFFLLQQIMTKFSKPLKQKANMDKNLLLMSAFPFVLICNRFLLVIFDCRNNLCFSFFRQHSILILTLQSSSQTMQRCRQNLDARSKRYSGYIYCIYFMASKEPDKELYMEKTK